MYEFYGYKNSEWPLCPRDFDDDSNQLEEGKIHDILQQCGKMAYSCFNWTVTITMNLPLEKLHIFTSMAAF